MSNFMEVGIFWIGLNWADLIVGNFLILQDCDEFKALFFKDPKWAGSNMMFRYRYKTEMRKWL